MDLSEYILKPRNERIAHVDLESNCTVDNDITTEGGRRYRAKKKILDFFGVTDDLDNWKAAKIGLCHLCPCDTGKGFCTNPLHLYIGRLKENQCDVPTAVKRRRGLGAKERGDGIHDRSDQRVIEGRRRGCALGRALSMKNGNGIHNKADPRVVAGNRKGGTKTHNMKTGIHDKNDPRVIQGCSEGGKIGGKTTAARKRMCLVTGRLSNPGALAVSQRSQGISTYLCSELDGSDLVSQTVLLGLVWV